MMSLPSKLRILLPTRHLGIIPRLINMQGLLRDVFNFNTANNEKNEFQSYTGEFTYHIAKIPLAEDEDDFYIKAKSTKWLEGILENSLKDGDIGTVIKCMINYLVTLLVT